MRNKYRVTLNEDEKAALDTIKAYYGTASNAIAFRHAVVEHAKQIKSEMETFQKQVMLEEYIEREEEQI